MYAHTLMHAIAHGGCTNTVRESALEVDWEKNPLLHQGLEPASLFGLAFQSDTLPAKLFLPLYLPLFIFFLNTALLLPQKESVDKYSSET